MGINTCNTSNNCARCPLLPPPANCKENGPRLSAFQKEAQRSYSRPACDVMSRVLANSLTFLDGARVQACLIWDPPTKVWNGKAQVGCMYIVNCPWHAILLVYIRIDMASKPHLKKCAPAGVWYLEHAAGRLARCGWVILDRETGFKKKLKYCQPRQLSKEARSQGFTRWVLKDVESVGS